MVHKQELAERYGVNARTIQRDLDDIRSHLADHLEGEELAYDRQIRGYRLDKRANS